MNKMTLRAALLAYHPHRDSAAASLIDKLAAAPQNADPWRLDLTREEHAMLGRVLAENDEIPSAVEVERAVADITAKKLRVHAKEITKEIARAEASSDSEAVAELLVAKKVVMRALEGLEE